METLETELSDEIKATLDVALKHQLIAIGLNRQICGKFLSAVIEELDRVEKRLED